MRLISLCFALVVFMLSSCEKSDKVEPFAARYKGHFVRTTGNALENPAMSNVTLEFTDNTFSGSSNTMNYPAICQGSFTISQTKINISNSCMFTANFDWTLIFNGEYNYDLSGDQLRIWRDYPDGKRDQYELRKEK